MPPETFACGLMVMHAQEEERATGRVDIHVYITYFAHWGRRFWLPGLAVLICSAARLDQVSLQQKKRK